MINKINSISLDCMKFQYGGGMERYVIDLVNGFHQEGIEPIVYSTKFNKELREYQFIKPIKVNLSFIPKPLRNLLLSFLFKRKKRNELSLTTIYTLSELVICGGNHKGYLNSMKKPISLGDKFKIANEQKSLLNAKQVIAHSNMMKEELVQFYNIEPHKISVIYPPVDVNKFTLPKNEQARLALRKKFGFNDHEIIYLFPSTGHSRKGYDLLKTYFQKTVLPIRLVVAGTPVTESEKITSLGYCKNMPELYQAADYTIMASQYEPFGLVGIESILSGTQIIFSKNMACLEVLKNNFGYSFSKNDLSNFESIISASVEKAQKNEHRIDFPFKCINYNPSLTTHIQAIIEEIHSIKNK